MGDSDELLLCVVPMSPALGVIMTATSQLVIDCADPEPLARFLYGRAWLRIRTTAGGGEPVSGLLA